VQEEKIVGAGGYNILEKEGRISWYFIHPDYHAQGIGKALVQHSLSELRQNEEIDRIIVRTSQHAWRFFEKMGFELQKTEQDFWAPGMDLYQMELKE
jgi:ribosomal-protein-alanine N-acetyltransferase